MNHHDTITERLRARSNSGATKLKEVAELTERKHSHPTNFTEGNQRAPVVKLRRQVTDQEELIGNPAADAKICENNAINKVTPGQDGYIPLSCERIFDPSEDELRSSSHKPGLDRGFATPPPSFLRNSSTAYNNRLEATLPASVITPLFRHPTSREVPRDHSNNNKNNNNDDNPAELWEVIIKQQKQIDQLMWELHALKSGLQN
jgi:hypothetical protein